jgi:hypothetical protein
MKIQDVLQQARVHRSSDDFDAYLQDYDVLIKHMDTEEVCVEVLLGDIYMMATGRKEKTMRFRNPPDHPLSVLAEYTDFVFGTTDREFDKELPAWIEKVGEQAAMKACLQFLKNGKNDLSLEEFDLKTVRALSYFDAEPVYRALDHVLRENDKKEYGGARSLKQVNQTIKTLLKLSTPRALQSVLRFERYARYGKTDKALKILMSEVNPTEAELEAMRTPTYHFDEQLTRVETVGDYTVIMTIIPGYKLARKILDAEGKEYKDFPKSGLEDFKYEVKELRGLEKVIAGDLRHYRDRIEDAYYTGQTWPYPDWVRFHMVHPLMAYSARRLIWEFTNEGGERYTGMWAENRQPDPESELQVILHNVSGKPLKITGEDWRVKLWHPVEASPEETAAWKNRVMDLKIVQPFKQAFREVYRPTRLELETATYSERFAAHILYKQQFAAIASSRGWDVPSFFDSYDLDTSINIQGHQVNFTYTHDERWGTEARTKYVSFSGVELSTLLPIVFSEGMRDVDLFVSVCSIGVDPTWTPERDNYSYWASYNTGELRDSALNRRDLLQRILPALMIAPQCRIDDRWLVVEGKLCTYKIHIGSGGVYMAPSNRYLCIVPKTTKKSASDDVFLPFESDGMLSLILSKAFLLADDININDRTIIRQIGSAS